MSFTVLVIPEDPLQNGHILRPLVREIMRDVGRPAAKVRLLTSPRFRGYDHAMQSLRGEDLEVYDFMDLWLFFPDADKATDDAMRDLEEYLAAKGITLLCCAPRPELEIYACAAFRSEIREPWESVRRHPRMREDVFQTLLKRHGYARQRSEGRDRMINQSLKNLPLLYHLCPELGHLRGRIARHLQEN